MEGKRKQKLLNHFETVEAIKEAKSKTKDIKDYATELNALIRMLDIEYDYYMRHIRDIAKKIKELKEHIEKKEEV